ncbi:MAG: RNA polymerase sigma-I factor [Clostridium sp.]|nr:RNA polymerase sigma-I factor [Clostridium sp.]
MFVNHVDKKDIKEEVSSVADIIKKIQKGDLQLKEEFIKDNLTYILRSVSNALGTVVDDKNSEEFSVGLSAFNEAIDRYDPLKNDNFFQYSFMVIKSRLIDYIRSNSKHNKVLPFSYIEESVHFEGKFLTSDTSRQFENIEVRQELETFERNLQQFGISLKDLVLSSPKHKDSRLLLIKIAKIIAGNNDMYKKLIVKGYVPLKDLLNYIKVNRKTIQRNRKFIIAVTLILRSNLYDLKEYILGFEKEGKYE